MWKLSLVAAAAVFATWGCLDPGCMRNSECNYGLECRASKCQKPLPAAATAPVAGQPAQCYAYWCPFVQDGGQLDYAGGGGHAAANTSTRYKDAGASGMGSSTAAPRDSGASGDNAGGAGGSL